MKKRAFIFLLALAMLISGTSVFASAKGNEYTYQVKDGEVSMQYFFGEDEEIFVPASIDGLPVTEIQEEAFAYAQNVKSVLIPNTVKGLPDGILPEGATVTRYTANDTIMYSAIQTSDSVTFKDVSKKAWFYRYVTDLAERGIVSGKEPGIYDPDGIFSRAELTRILAAMAGVEPDDTVEYAEIFDDVDAKHWAVQYIGWAFSNELVFGVGDNMFKPDSPITRQDACVLFMRYNNNMTDEALPEFFEKKTFADGEDIADYAAQAVSMLQMAGIIDGDDGYFHPEASITRAEAAKIASAFIAVKEGQEPPFQIGPEPDPDEPDEPEEPPVDTSLHVERGTYGTSGQGRNLAYTSIYRAGYTKTIVLVFEQHGFEDIYWRDGQELVDAANQLIAVYSNENINIGSCRLVFIPSANPDALAEGWTQDGPGRCTVVGGVDMNRDWPTSTYYPMYNSRNYTPYPLSVSETKSLRDFIVSLDAAVLLDFHGWLNETYGDPALARIFRDEMGLPYGRLFSETMGLSATNTTYQSPEAVVAAYRAGLLGFPGYLCGWGYEQGIQSALVEFSYPGQISISKLKNAVDRIISANA